MPYTVFSVDIPYSLMWGKEGWLPLRLDGKDYYIAFERSWRPDSRNMEIKYDRLGRMSYTKIAIRFPYATMGDVLEVLRGVAHKAINRLLDVYRIATKEYYIGHIPIHELDDSDTSHGICVIEDDGSVWQRHTSRSDFGLGLTLSPMEEMDNQAKLDLVYEHSLSVLEVLVLNARRSLLFEDYRIAIIEAQTAFEVGVDTVITRYYLSMIYSKEKVNKLLDAGLRNLLKYHLPKAAGKEFFGTDEYDQWEKHLYKLRNAVIHDGKEVQREEALSALAAAEKSLVYIGAISPWEWPENVSV